MPKRDLGEVKGKDGGFGDVSAEYIDNGGDPSVEIETQGANQAKNFIFKFKNLVRSALSSEQIDSIVSNEVVTSSSVVTGTGLTSFWSKIKEKFALKHHTHETTDLLNEAVTTPKIANEAVTTEKIDDKAITQAKIADGAVGETQLDTALRNSISQRLNDPILPVSYLDNVLLVSPDPDHWTSKPCRVVKDPGAGITAYGLPGELESASTVMCVRYVQIISDKHIAVWLFENFPSGRIWTNFYNNYVWDGWRQI